MSTNPRVINIGNGALIAWSLAALLISFLIGWVIGTILWGSA